MPMFMLTQLKLSTGLTWIRKLKKSILNNDDLLDAVSLQEKGDIGKRLRDCLNEKPIEYFMQFITVHKDRIRYSESESYENTLGYVVPCSFDADAFIKDIGYEPVEYTVCAKVVGRVYASVTAGSVEEALELVKDYDWNCEEWVAEPVPVSITNEKTKERIEVKEGKHED